MSGLFKLKAPMKMNYIKLHGNVPFEGGLAQNDLLQKAKYIAHKKMRGPECIEFSKDGEMYTGVMSGQIVRIDVATNSVETIVQIGDETNTTLCSLENVKGHVPTCGCPLGIRFHPNDPELLYVTDAFYGIVKVNVKTGKKTTVLSSNDPRFKDAPMKLTDDLDIDGDIIYFVDSSYEHTIDEAFAEFLEGVARGRLYSYNEKTDMLEFITGNLYFPNGMQLMPNKKEVLINEVNQARIIKVQLNGTNKGSKEVFLDLPGHGDTIRLSKHNTLLVPFVDKLNPFLNYFGEYPLIRSILVAIIDFEALIKIAPKYGFVAEYDLNGKALRSWHDPTGNVVNCATSLNVHENKVYVGSYKDDYIAVIDY